MSQPAKPKAMVAMSGGVDSSVAALLAMRMGYDCLGVTMKLFKEAAGASDAERVAAALGIPHQTFDFTDEFRAAVIEPFIASYGAGATPNPCVQCNASLKFGVLYEKAMSMGFDKLVTGHYARVLQGPDGSYRLVNAIDRDKDQSYFLYGISPEKLSRVLFPLGGLTKKETREIAAEAGFVNAEKRESQDICFVKDGRHTDFIGAYRGKPFEPGNFVDASGHVLGRHGGIEHFTIGQRKGLGIALGRRVFVKEIRPETGEVVLADESEVFATRIEIMDMNWLAPGLEEDIVLGPVRKQIMIRYNAALVWATISLTAENRLLAVFDEPVRAPARGQAAVLYDGDTVAGGGRIV